MTVLAYMTASPGGVDVGYEYYTGQVELTLSDNAEIDIGQIVYDELQTLPATTQSQYGYAYIWKAYLFYDPVTLLFLTTWKSNPPRYKIGHLCATTVTGVVWDDIWKYADQVTPLFKGSFYTDNPNPGDGFPFGTIPLGESRMSVWTTAQGNYNQLLTPNVRATFLNTFMDNPADVLVRVTYTAFLSFTGLDILAFAPKPYVVVYP